MKILLISPAPPPYGGIANWTLLMRNYIEKQEGMDLEFLNIAPKSRSLDGRTLWDRVVKQGLIMFKQRRKLKDLLRRSKIDVIHMTTSGQLAIIRDIVLLKMAKSHNIPITYHIHFGRIPEIAKTNTREWKLLSYALKLSSVVMSIDDATNQCIQEHFPNIKTVCIPNPIDITKLPHPSEIMSKEIVFLGWNIKSKGIEELIKAWNIIGRKYPTYKLNLIGPSSNDYLLHLKSLATVDNILFSGEKAHDEAMRILSACCVFILPSYTEGFPNVIVEAMALGKPIIATKVGAIPDMLSNNCGVLINPKSVDDIKQALEDLLSDEHKRILLSKNAYRKACSIYHIDNVYVQYYKVWEDLIGNARRRKNEFV